MTDLILLLCLQQGLQIGSPILHSIYILRAGFYSFMKSIKTKGLWDPLKESLDINYRPTDVNRERVFERKLDPTAYTA